LLPNKQKNAPFSAGNLYFLGDSGFLESFSLVGCELKKGEARRSRTFLGRPG
jgi:hypothetical protein